VQKASNLSTENFILAIPIDASEIRLMQMVMTMLRKRINENG
jgi:hypothetical protein